MMRMPVWRLIMRTSVKRLAFFGRPPRAHRRADAAALASRSEIRDDFDTSVMQSIVGSASAGTS
jgi:hypothetical protein